MGYTNYYYKKNDVKKLPQGYLDDCRKVVDKWNSTHEPTKLDLNANENAIVLNGEAATCEWFVIDVKDDDSFNFTKTRADAYDSAVKALCILGKRHGVISKWSFDGDVTDVEYANAVALLEECGLGTVGTENGVEED